MAQIRTTIRGGEWWNVCQRRGMKVANLLPVMGPLNITVCYTELLQGTGFWRDGFGGNFYGLGGFVGSDIHCLRSCPKFN